MSTKSNAARRLPPETRPRIQLEPKSGEIAANLDRLLHDRMRLGIVSALAAGDELSFTDLKAALSATDGNLSVHARKLEEAGYVSIDKSFVGRKPLTEASLTEDGRAAFVRYLDAVGLMTDAESVILTRGGLRSVELHADSSVTIDMGMATTPRARALPHVSVGDRSWPATGVLVPNPHAVVFVDDLARSEEHTSELQSH